MQYRLTLPLAAALVLVACADDTGERSPTSPGSLPWRTSASLEISPETRQLEGLARRFALALNEPGFRQRLHARLRTSPYRENKLPFRVEAGERGWTTP